MGSAARRTAFTVAWRRMADLDPAALVTHTWRVAPPEKPATAMHTLYNSSPGLGKHNSC